MSADDDVILFLCIWTNKLKHICQIYTQDIEIKGWCPLGTVLPHGEKVPLQPWLATLLVMLSW